MTETDKPKPLDDAQMDQVEGGGMTGSDPGTSGYEPVTLERGARAPYIGETEKNVWKAPAGVTHDTEFEN